MKLEELEKLENEGAVNVSSKERRTFLKAGLAITGVFMGGTVLSLTSAGNVKAKIGSEPNGDAKFPFSPHYSMVMRQNRCVDCQLCMEACVKTNHVPHYGYRTTILESFKSTGPSETERVFVPVLCNQCNRPPCVRVCPTRATYKDKTTGIVMMDSKKCIGCTTCMSACPYNARYFNEEVRAIDKCNFCYDTRLSKGKKDTACVEACPADVRVFGDLSDTTSKVYQLIHAPDKVVWVLRPETGALPNVYYIND